ncbi:hypothetical protein Taiwan905_04100 [Helicobacter pylori]
MKVTQSTVNDFFALTGTIFSNPCIPEELHLGRRKLRKITARYCQYFTKQENAFHGFYHLYFAFD